MKKLFTLVLLLGFFTQINAQERYLDEVFTDVKVTTDVVYGANFSVITIPVFGVPTKLPLLMDIYEPDGDTATDRPLILMFHTGNFLPQIVNGSISGLRTDPYLVDLAERLARHGYVVASVDYRQGWDPLNPSQEVRTNTLINAAWRGVQDASSCVRYFRKTEAEAGNPWGIDGEKIVSWGLGTGGYIVLAQGTLDEYPDILLPKFIGSDVTGDGNPDPMVLEPINGDLRGETIIGINPATGDTLAVPNNPGYPSEVQMMVNMGGALGDISWMDESDPPLISYQVPSDPFAPYLSDILIVPTTGDLIVEVQGAGVNVPTAVMLGNNDAFANNTFTDPFTMRANAINDGNEGLFPLVRPIWDLNMDGTPETAEASPWEYWDVAFWSMSQQGLDGMGGPCEGVPVAQCNWDLISRRNNPDMTFEKASAYLDTIVGYFLPRANLVLALTSATEEVLNDELNVQVNPNPFSDFATITVDSESLTGDYMFSILDMSGKLMTQRTVSMDGTQINVKVDGSDLSPGMYIYQFRGEEGIFTGKIVLKR